MAWESNGIRGRGDPPPVLGNFHGPLLVVAGAYCVWEDLKAACALAGGPWPCDIMCVNDIGIYLPWPYQHLVSYHADKLPMIVGLRWSMAGRAHIRAHIWTHGPLQPGGAEIRWDLPAGGGTSTLLGTLMGLAMGYDRIILAGAPMDNGGHFFGPPPNYLPGVEETLKHGRFETRTLELEWGMMASDLFADRVRSLSGRTKMWLGAPTEEWLYA